MECDSCLPDCGHWNCSGCHTQEIIQPQTQFSRDQHENVTSPDVISFTLHITYTYCVEAQQAVVPVGSHQCLADVVVASDDQADKREER